MINDIKAAIPGLKKKGNSYWAKCPFHHEKTASFKVDFNHGLWYCFGCGEGGNLHQLMRKLGKEPPKNYVYTPIDDDSPPKPHSVANLIFDKGTTPVYSEFAKRGISKKPVDMAHIKRITRNQLKDICESTHFAIEKRFTGTSEIHFAPLFYDGFIAGGQLIEIYWNGERWKSTQHTLKDTPAKHCFYELRSGHPIVYVVESLLDAMAVAEMGLDAISTITCRITEEQMQRLPADIQQITLFLDNDEAGIKGSKKAYWALRNMGYMVDFYKYNGHGDDPNEILINKKGAVGVLQYTE